MCICVFLGSDVRVPTSDWSEEDPHFHVQEWADGLGAVKRHFSKAYVYYLASHEGCGCGFEWDAREGMRELEECAQEWETMSEELKEAIGWSPSDERRWYEARKKAAEDLATFLKRLLKETHELELGVFQSGDWDKELATECPMTPDELAQGQPNLFPVEGILYKVRRHGGSR